MLLSFVTLVLLTASDLVTDSHPTWSVWRNCRPRSNTSQRQTQAVQRCHKW